MSWKAFFLIAGLILLAGGPAGALAQEPFKLDQPDLSGGKPVLSILQDRHSSREFSSAALDRRQIAEILWAAGGVNRRHDDGSVGFTYPNSHNDQAMIVYAITRDGAYRYDPIGHELVLLAPGDHRAVAGVQSYVADAPLNLLYVADMSRITSETETERLMTAALNAGHMAENVYLYATMEKLNVISRSNIDRDELRLLFKLPIYFEPILGQTVGLPGK